MFESIAIRKRSSASLGQPFDLGSLAEALIFYGKVRLIANHAVLKNLLEATTPELVIDLLESDFMKLAYEADDVVILTEHTGTPNENHTPTYFNTPTLELQEFLPRTLERIIGKPGRARRLARRMARKVEIIRHTEKISDDTRRDLSDSGYVQRSVSTLLRAYVPEYRGRTNFSVECSDKKLSVSSDIDWNKVNNSYHTRVPASHSSLSPAYLLAHLASAKADLYFSAKYESEIAIDDINAMINRENLGHFLTDFQSSSQPIGMFQEFVFDDSRAIAEAVRDGSASLSDVLEILPDAVTFKQWLQSDAAQQDLVKAYFREAFAQTWVDKLPTKAARWFLFTALGLGVDALGAGGLGTAAGVALGATDTFVLDKILKGWKPSQFVDSKLQPLLPSNRERVLMEDPNDE